MASLSSPLPEPLAGKCAAGTGLKILFKFLGLAFINKAMKSDEFPRAEFCGVGRLPGVVCGKSLVEIGGESLSADASAMAG